jgi:hypothetical protein
MSVNATYRGVKPINQFVGLPGSGRLSRDERDRLFERGAARTGVTHLRVFVPNRHAAEEDEPVWG